MENEVIGFRALPGTTEKLRRCAHEWGFLTPSELLRFIVTQFLDGDSPANDAHQQTEAVPQT